MKRLLAIPVIAMALGLAACGQSAQEKYSKAINADVQKAGSQIIAASQKVSATSSNGTDDTALSNAANDLRALARQINALKVPKGVESDNAALASEITGFAAQIDAAAHGGKPADLVSNTKLTVGRIKATIAQINGDL